MSLSINLTIGIILFLWLYFFILFFKFYKKTHQKAINFGLTIFVSAFLGVVVFNELQYLLLGEVSFILINQLYFWSFFVFVAGIILIIISFSVVEVNFKFLFSQFLANGYYSQQIIFVLISLIYAKLIYFNELTLCLLFLSAPLAILFVFILEKVFLEIKEYPLLGYFLFLFLCKLEFISVFFCIFLFVLFSLYKLFLRLLEKNKFFLSVKEDTATHEMHMNLHFPFFIWVRTQAVKFGFLLTFCVMLKKSLCFGFLSPSMILFLEGLTPMLQQLLFLVYLTLFFIHVIILAACNKGQGLDLLQVLVVSAAAATVTSVTGYFVIALNSVVSGNTVSAELSNELNNTLNTGPVTTNNDNSTHFSVTGQFNRGDRSAPAVAASLAHYESILPFVTCEEDRILVRQFIARVYERPPTYFFEGVEQLDYRKITLILHLTKCYEENYSAYVLSVPYDGNRIHLERLSNTQLSSLCTDGPLSRLRSNPVEPGLSMDWDQQIENLRSIEKGWNKYYLPPEQGNTNWHKAELKINRLICEQNYIDELRALQTKTTDYSKRLGLEVRITKVMESSKVDP